MVTKEKAQQYTLERFENGQWVGFGKPFRSKLAANAKRKWWSENSDYLMRVRPI